MQMRYLFGIVGLVGGLCLGMGRIPAEAGSVYFKYITPDGEVVYTNVHPRNRQRRPPLRLDPRKYRKYDRWITEIARRYRIDRRLILAIIAVESDFDPRAVSRKGAMGLMQLMPATARRYGVRNPFDPYENIHAGVRHLRYLMQRYGSDLRLVLAAYNAGEQAVDQYRDIPPYPETRQYVRNVLRLYGRGYRRIYRYRDARGVIHFSERRPDPRIYKDIRVIILD